MDKTINLLVCDVCDMIQANKIFTTLGCASLELVSRDNPELNLLLSEFSITKYRKDILE